MDWKTLLFAMSGRINRGKYWLGILFVILGLIALGIIAVILYMVGGDSLGMILAGIVGLAALAFSIFTTLGLMSKRLHDREKSAWWILVFGLLPSVLSVAGQALGGIGTVLALASLAISIWALVELGCLKGTTGPNQYGPDPLPAEPD
jgi:uncharacterized membrane protein YhaH (DUF805 family)